MTSREHAQPAGRSSGNTLFYISCAVVAALLTVFGVLADQVVDGDTASFDYSFVMLFRDPATPSVPIGPPWFNEAVRDVTALGSFSVLGILVIGVVLHLLLTGSRRTSLLIAISVLGGTTISMVLKALFDRPRPDFTGAVDVFTASFPSGHATASAVVYLTIGVLLAQRASTWPARTLYLLGAIILVAAIGLSRILSRRALSDGHPGRLGSWGGMGPDLPRCCARFAASWEAAGRDASGAPDRDGLADV